MTDLSFLVSPLQLSRTPLALHGEYISVGGGETPLPSVESSQGSEVVIVNIDIIRTYERMIFELERKVLQYQILFKQLMRKPEEIQEAVALPSSPLNPASIALVNSIIRARVPEESILRAWDAEE